MFTSSASISAKGNKTRKRLVFLQNATPTRRDTRKQLSTFFYRITVSIDILKASHMLNVLTWTIGATSIVSTIPRHVPGTSSLVMAQSSLGHHSPSIQHVEVSSDTGLPNELWTYILQFLSYLQLVCCRRVSKTHVVAQTLHQSSDRLCTDIHSVSCPH